MKFKKSNNKNKYFNRNSFIVKVLAALFALIFAGSLLVQVIAYR